MKTKKLSNPLHKICLDFYIFFLVYFVGFFFNAEFIKKRKEKTNVFILSIIKEEEKLKDKNKAIQNEQKTCNPSFICI